MAKTFQALDRRHLPSLYDLKSIDVNLFIDPGCPTIQKINFGNYIVLNHENMNTKCVQFYKWIC